MARRYEGNRILKPSRIRGVVAGVVAAAIVVGIIWRTGWGSMSAFGFTDLYLLCPLGSLEAMLGSHSIILRALIGLAVVVILVLIFGKTFCAWACPTSFISRFISTKKTKAMRKKDQEGSADQALEKYKINKENLCGGGKGSAGCSACKSRKLKFDSRFWVLIGALLATLIFGFPVFCLVCPIGLTFGTVIALVRFIGFNEPSIGLLLFPAIIVFEMLVLRRWCHTVCPISALMSLVSAFNRTLRPKVDESKCLRTSKGEDCNICSTVCPELIDPRFDLGERPLTECTRCGKCLEACPQGAIRFLGKKKKPKAEDVEPAGQAEAI